MYIYAIVQILGRGGIIYSACMWLMIIILRNFRANKTRIKNYILVQGWLMEIGLFRWEWR